MRGDIILFTVLLSAVSGYQQTNFLYSEQKHPSLNQRDSEEGGPHANKDTTVEPAAISTSATSSSLKPLQTSTPLSSIGQSELEAPHEGPIAGQEPLAASPPSPQEIVSITEGPSHPAESGKRRIVTYDQRQEGQYNLRADLENFMFVFIPSSAASGLNLLDLLAKSNTRRSSTKSKRKHYQAVAGQLTKPHLNAGRYQQEENYWRRSASNGLGEGHHPSPLHVSPLTVGSRAGEFIEGRTPYHVDISANDEEQSRLHPEQVDVLPPPVYPFGHLIKPYYHLEAEPAAIQALPPSLADLSLHGSHAPRTPYITAYKPPLSKVGPLPTATEQSAAGSEEVSGRNSKLEEGTYSDYYRMSRAIMHNDFVDSNRVSSGAPPSYGVRRTNVPLYRTEYSSGAAQLYPPIDVPRFESLNLNARSVALEATDAEDEIQNLTHDRHIGEIIVPSAGEDDIDLSGAIFIDAEAKALLSDGMERCAPGRRRDSYGVCREIEGY